MISATTRDDNEMSDRLRARTAVRDDVVCAQGGAAESRFAERRRD